LEGAGRRHLYPVLKKNFVSLLEFLGGSKKIVATFDVREKKLNIYNDSFEWEGKN